MDKEIDIIPTRNDYRCECCGQLKPPTYGCIQCGYTHWNFSVVFDADGKCRKCGK